MVYLVTVLFYGRRDFHEIGIMSVVHGDTAQNLSLWSFPVTKCFFQIYVIFPFLKWLHGTSETSLVLLGQVLVC